MPSNTTNDNATISIAARMSVPAAEIEPLWRELESRTAAKSFFLSWHWIGTMLELAQSPANLLIATSGGRVVGLGLLFSRKQGRFGMSWPALSLHQTGDSGLDSIYIEDNGFLAEAGLERAVTAACLRHLVETDASWAELRLGGAPELLFDEAKRTGLALEEAAEHPCPFADLRQIEPGGYRGFGNNAPGQIARAERLYRERGEIAVIPSRDLSEALTNFMDMKLWHQQHWSAKGKAGAFASDPFERFHRILLTKAFPSGEADVVKVAAGQEAIGFLYTFFYGEDAYAYQSGLNYERDRRLKPGLVCHAAMIRHCQTRGIARYRLLAGDSRYKRSLANESYNLHWVSLRRPHLAFRIETTARRLWHR